MSKPHHIKKFSIGVIWLVHLAGMIGIHWGYEDWFITKTPLNLSLIFLLLTINFPIRSKHSIIMSIIIFMAGMIMEWLGVHTGFPFGNYAYGENLGVKLDGVPLLIGINWVVLTLITAALVSRVRAHNALKASLGALLMVAIDYTIEHSAPVFDYWQFEGGVPFENYAAWFSIAFPLQYLYQKWKLEGDIEFSLHLYVAQFVFFTSFYVV